MNLLTRRGTTLWLLAALFMAALAVRPQLGAIAPLLTDIRESLDISHSTAGVLATIPVVCMGLFSPLGPMLGTALGSRTTITAGLILIGAASIARGLIPGAVPVILMTVPIGAAMGILGAVMAVAVKERFADRPALATGVYATGINAGAGLGALVAAPLAAATDGWRDALLILGALTLVPLAVWITSRPPGTRRQRAPLRLPRLAYRNGTAWLLVLLFGISGATYYGILSWLPEAYVERGWSEQRAGTLLAVFVLLHIPTGLLIPYLADRLGSRRLYLATCTGVIVIGMLGTVVAPGAAWLWIVLAGLAAGATFPLMLTMPLDMTDNPAEVGPIIGLMLGAGYLISGLSPFALGAIRDLSGSFVASLWVIVGLGAVWFLSCLPLSPARLRRRAARPADAVS